MVNGGGKMTEILHEIDPYRILNIDTKRVSDEKVHQAYLEAVRRYPPDKNPAGFQRVRDAYEMIKTQEDRTRIDLFGIETKQSLSEILPEGSTRIRAGIELWISMIETEAKRMKENLKWKTIKDKV